MTRDNTIDLLSAITCAFPNFKLPNLETAVSLWHSMLQDYSYDDVSKALVTYIKCDTSGYAPSIGQIISKIHSSSSNSDYPTPQEAWECLIDDYVSCSGDYKRAKENYESMPVVLKKCVGGADALNDMALMDVSTLNSVEKSHFIKTYNAVLNDYKERVKMRQSTNCINQKENIGIEG